MRAMITFVVVQIRCLLQWIRSFLDRNLFTLLAWLAVGAVILFVPQIAHLLPNPSAVGAHQSETLLATYVAGLLLLYGLAYWWVIPFAQPEQTAIVASQRRFHPQAVHSQRRITKLLERPQSIRGRSRVVLFGIFVGTAAFIYWGGNWIELSFGELTDFGERPIRATYAIILGIAAVWTLLKDLTTDFVRVMFGRAIVFMLLAYPMGEAIWFAAQRIDLLSMRNYSLWAIVHCAFMVILVARISDKWQYHSKFPIRFAFVVGTVAVVAMLRASPIAHGQFVDATLKDPPSIEAWLTDLENRIDTTGNDEPLIFVAASGGGSRAALFTSLVLEGLTQSISYHANGATHEYSPAKHIILISSVSGGSLGSAYAVMNGFKPFGPGHQSLQNSWEEDLINGMGVEIASLAKQSSSSEEMDATLSEIQALQSSEKTAPASAPWLLSSVAMDDMCTDFMAPLLRGVLSFGIERGASTSNFFRVRLRLDNSRLPADEALASMVLFNATQIENGSRIVIGEPPLPASFFVNVDEKSPPTRTMADIHPAFRPGIADAVRLSANFPWGFAVGELPQAPSEQPDGSKTTNCLHITDGGVFDNTGLGTIREFLESLEHHAATIPRAESVLTKLRRRGIVLLEIDSGAKPTDPSALARMFPEPLEPVLGIENAGYANAFDSKLDHRAMMQKVLLKPWTTAVAEPTNDAALQSLVQQSASFDPLLHLPIQCNHQKNVMTAWALGPQDKAAVLVRFLKEWKVLQKQLKDHLIRHATLREPQALAIQAMQESPSVNVYTVLKPVFETTASVQGQIDAEAAERRRQDLGVIVADSEVLKVHAVQAVEVNKQWSDATTEAVSELRAMQPNE